MGETGRALYRITQGMGIVLVGTVASMFLTFLSRTLIARHFDRYQYGSFTLTMTVLSIAVTVALLGLQSGLPREISRYLTAEKEKVPALVSTGIALALAASILMMALTVFLASPLAPLLNDRYLDKTLSLISPAIPFIVLTMLLVAVSRGNGRVRENLYYKNLLSPLLFLVILVAGLLAGADFTFVFLAYVLAQVISSILLVRESFRLGFLPRRPIIDLKIARELFLFSMPLMLTGILDYVMEWADSLMLGYYFGPDKVGLYNGATPIAMLLTVFLNSMGFLYIPTATTFFTSGDIDGFKEPYCTITRWTFLLTFPMFLFIFVFPKSAITLFFGYKYIDAATTLRILAAGFMFHVMMGLNGMSLTVIGETSANLMGNFFAAVANIGLNVVLIPPYGINGAAVATAVSFIVANVFRSGWLYRKTGIHPFSESYVKQIMAASAVLGLLLIAKTPSSDIWGVLVVLTLSFAGYLVLVLLAKSIEKEDVELLEAVGEKFGINLDPIIKLLTRFIED